MPPRLKGSNSREAWSAGSINKMLEDGLKKRMRGFGFGLDGGDEESMTAFVSPVKAWAINFWMNQAFGVFPSTAHDNFMVFVFRPVRLLWTFMLKFSIIVAILVVMHKWLEDQGFTFGDLWKRAFGHDDFSRTDYFAIVSHMIFLQCSALFIFFANLRLGTQLTQLNAKLRSLTETVEEGEPWPNPSVAKVMVYRFGICGVCTITSIIYLIAVHGIVRNPEVGFLDVLLIALIAFALFIENQNHMFTELLFLRFGHILKHHFIHILTHVKSPHAKGKDSRMCCYRRSKALYDMFWAINKTFGTDLLITISILVISISFGIYLSIAFLVFIGDHREHLLFILAYLLYWIAPTIRLYVIIEGSEIIRHQIWNLREQFDKIEAEMICDNLDSLDRAGKMQIFSIDSNTTTVKAAKAGEAKTSTDSGQDVTGDLARIRLVNKRFTEIANGFTANGFFFLNR